MSIQQDKFIKIADKIRTHLGHENAIVPNSFPDEIDKVRDTAYASGDSNGYQRGHDEGYSAGETEGYNSGYQVGESVGYDTGFEVGRTEGYYDGRDEGYNSGYRAGESVGYDTGFEVGRTEGYYDGRDEGYSTGFEEGKAAAESAGGKIVRGCWTGSADTSSLTISGVGFKPAEVRMYALGYVGDYDFYVISFAWKASGAFIWSAEDTSGQVFKNGQRAISISLTANNDGFQVYTPSSSAKLVQFNKKFPYLWEAFEKEQDDWTA